MSFERDPLGSLSAHLGVADSPILIASNWIRPGADEEWEAHHHPDHELLWGVDGAVAVEVGDERFTVPAVHGLWIPSGHRHRVVNLSATRLNCTWFSPEFTPWSGRDVVALPVSDLLREVLVHLQLPTTLTGAALERRRRAERFAFDVLEGELDAAWSLPLPATPALRALAEAMQARPGEAWTCADAARFARMSERTLRRRFQEETGMGFAEWRRLLRIHASIGLLQQGATVASVGASLGYRSTSAFTHAYRSVIGLSPIAHLRRMAT